MNRLTRAFIAALFAALLIAAALPPHTALADPASPVTGPGWAVVAVTEAVEDPTLGILYYDQIYMVNTDTGEKNGPFLRDELSTFDSVSGKPRGADLFDVAITPDGKTALVTSFAKMLLHFIDLTIPLEPAYLGSVKLDMYAEDIAITADGLYAIVTDGAFEQSLYSFDIRRRALAYELLMPTIDHASTGAPIYGASNAVAIGPDGTVILADYFNSAIHTATIGKGGSLTYLGTHYANISKTGEFSQVPGPELFRLMPVNAAISPDGQTVLVSYTADYADTTLPQYTSQHVVGVYRVTAPGEVEFAGAITGLPHVMQTIAFTEAGDRAVMLGNQAFAYDVDADPAMTQPDDALYLVDINGPGDVSLSSTAPVGLGRATMSQLFGVDGLAVYRGKAYATYSALSANPTLMPLRHLSVLDLSTMALTQIEFGPTNDFILAGVAVRPYTPELIYLPLIKR